MDSGAVIIATIGATVEASRGLQGEATVCLIARHNPVDPLTTLTKQLAMPIAATLNSGLSNRLQNLRREGLARTGQAIERLSTGKRINRPSDDPSGFVAAEQFRGELTVAKAQLRVGELSRLALNQEASTLANVQGLLVDLRGEIIAVADGLLSNDQQESILNTIDATLQAIDLIGAGDQAAGLESLRSLIEEGQTGLAQTAVDAASSSTTRQRAGIAAEQNSLAIDQRLLEDKVVITSEALSQVEDTDFAEETANLSESQIITQAATAALTYEQRTQVELIGTLLDEVADVT